MPVAGLGARKPEALSEGSICAGVLALAVLVLLAVGWLVGVLAAVAVRVVVGEGWLRGCWGAWWAGEVVCVRGVEAAWVGRLEAEGGLGGWVGVGVAIGVCLFVVVRGVRKGWSICRAASGMWS